jgi:hypothetical protein
MTTSVTHVPADGELVLYGVFGERAQAFYDVSGNTLVTGVPSGGTHSLDVAGTSVFEVAGGVVRSKQPFVEEMTQTATVGTATLTIAQLLTKVIDGTPTAAATYTLPTPALLVAGITDCQVGDSFTFLVNNKSTGANTITIAEGSGATSDGTLTVAQNVIRPFVVIVTNVTASSEAYFVYGLG